MHRNGRCNGICKIAEDTAEQAPTRAYRLLDCQVLHLDLGHRTWTVVGHMIQTPEGPEMAIGAVHRHLSDREAELLVLRRPED